MESVNTEIWVLGALVAGDIFTTGLIVGMHGLNMEANGFVKALFETLSFNLGLIAFASILIILLVVLQFGLQKINRKLAKGIMWILIVERLAIVLINASMLKDLGVI